MNSPIYLISIIFFLALAVSWSVFHPVLNFAKKNRIYDNPEERKLQRHPIPVLGGVVVAIGLIVSIQTAWIWYDCRQLIAVELLALVMFIVGTIDDMKNLKPSLRLGLEVLAAVILIFVNDSPINNLHGLFGVNEFSPWIAWPLTVFALVGIINAVNMVDGVDGLSSGLGIMSCLMFALLFFYAHDYIYSFLAVAAAGALVPFFIYNVFGTMSKMFIGDGGTMMLGMLLGSFVVEAISGSSQVVVCLPEKFGFVSFTIAVLAIPVGDTLRVMTMRKLRGVSVFEADKTHLHHAFIKYGFTHLETALCEIILNAVIVALWWLTYKSDFPLELQFAVVVGAAASVVCGLYYLLGRKERMAARKNASNSTETSIDQ